MTVAVTGGSGFLGWHVRCALLRAGIEGRSVERPAFDDPSSLRSALAGATAIVHAAGVNRANDPADVAAGNIALAERLVEALATIDGPPVTLIYANSTQSQTGGAYGDSKAKAGEILAAHQAGAGGRFVDLVLPHLFGEFGRPYYNSAVATFAHQLAIGEEPRLTGNGVLELLHAQDVATAILDELDAGESTSTSRRLDGRSIDVGAALDLLRSQHQRYVVESTVPAPADDFELHIFNMLRAALYRSGYYPRRLVDHRDPRGAFSELCRADGTGQTSFSTSVPGITRGDHYHLRKIERFIVVQGRARIRVRRLLTDEVLEFEATAEDPVMIDMPPLCTHNITNIGSDIMGTVFWAGDHFDPAAPDTFAEPVDLASCGGAGR